MKNRLALIVLLALASFACSGNNDNAHTTATTFVTPPARQVLHEKWIPTKIGTAKPDNPKMKVDPNKPLLIFHLPNGKTIREGEEVVIDFSIANARLRDDRGDFRVRYIVDDEEMKWIDKVHELLVLTGWTPGKHTIRLELIGPDGWPYRNGDYNVVTRELTVVK